MSTLTSPAPTSEPIVKQRRRKRPGAYLLTSVLAAIIAIIFTIPLIWTVAGSLRPSQEVFRYISPLSWETFIPQSITFENFITLTQGSFGLAILNSLLVAGITVIVGLAICASAAFGLSALKFRGQTVVFSVVVLTFLIPFDSISIPLANLFRDWNLQNTFAGLILPGLGNGIAIFLLRQFFLGIPTELVEAGRLDGLGWWGIFRRIYLPLSAAPLVGAGLTLFLFQWQAYVWPLLIGTDKYHVLGPIALAAMQGQYTADFGLMFAGSVVLTLIPLLAILRFQRVFTQSLSTTGIK